MFVELCARKVVGAEASTVVVMRLFLRVGNGGKVGRRCAGSSSDFVRENEPRSHVGGEPEAASRAGGAIARRIGESDACRLARVAFDESPTFARCSRSEDTLYVRVVSEK